MSSEENLEKNDFFTELRKSKKLLIEKPKRKFPYGRGWIIFGIGFVIFLWIPKILDSLAGLKCH